MLINNKNGSYGMFSRAGRVSTEKFNILMKKEEILNGTGKKFKPPDLFAQAKDEALKYHLENQDEIQQIFLDENVEEKNKKHDKKKQEKMYTSNKSDADMEKFQEIRNKTKRLNQIPCCTKYDPKNTYIWKRAKEIPGWETTVGKNKSIKKKEIIPPKFYKDHEFDVQGKNFVDLSRQLKRKPFIKVDKENDKSLNFSTSNKNIYNVDRKGLKTANGLGRSKYSRTRLNINETDENSNKYNGYTGTENQFNEDNGGSKKEFSSTQRSFSSFPKFKKSKGFKSTNLRNSRSANPLNPRRWVNNPAPDFKKVISRETRERMYDDKKRVMPFSIPPYEKTRPSKLFL